MTNITLLDGGMGQELIRRSLRPAAPLWSAEVMMHEPHIVEDVHRAYIDAGATVITLNAYSATPERLARDASEALFEPLQQKAIEVARQAIDGRDVALAGCLPPLFGSYHPEWAPDEETCLATYGRIVACQRDHVDVFLCETLSSIKEARTATRAAAACGKPVWCAMSVMEEDGSRLRSGEDLAEGVAAAREEGAAAILLNCSPPEAINRGLPTLVSSGLPVGGYANGFVKADDLDIGGTVEHLAARTDLDPSAYADHAMRWVDNGATIIGGCCEVGPAHISEIHAQLVKAGHRVVGVG